MRTLHLVSYEKFLPTVVDVVEAANPQNNRYVAYNFRGELPYKLRHENACRMVKGEFELDESLLNDLAWCDALFLHPLHSTNSSILEAVAADKVVVWCAMGADYYSLSPYFQDRLYLPHTRKTLEEPSEGTTSSLKKELREFLKSFPYIKKLSQMHRRLVRHSKKTPLVRNMWRVDFMAVMERELGLEKEVSGFRAKRLPFFSHYSLEQVLSAGAGAVEGPDILIGNSATWANNHLDLFDQMQGLDLAGRQIVLPLSYGLPAVGDLVEKRAKEVFGSDRVLALRDWMPIEDYNRTLSRCGTVLMNHIRGQAFGNICSMLFRGATVHLRPENPCAEFLEELGVTFRHIPNHRINTETLAPISTSERQHNAKLMRDYWRHDAVVARTEQLFIEVEREVDRRRMVSVR